MSQCVRRLSNAAKVRAEEEMECRQLLVSQHPESRRTLNIKVIGFGCGPWRWYKGVGEIHMNKGRVGEERKGKEMDGCPLTSAT
jgi:hypothetical protein